jgi:branched-chain amino acid transport system permease protein
MFKDLKKRTAALLAWTKKGRNPYFITAGALIITTLMVYFNPLSVPAFLLFLFSTALVYMLPLNRGFRVVTALVIALVLIPVIGIRNISYLEVIFQICVFAALALGLNIVVGFTGLLNMGYIAFYAVGAYLWAFFGSQQPFLLHSIPGTVPPGTPFLLNPNFFFLFLFLGMAVTAVVGILLGLPVLRVRGDYLAIVTLGFGELIRVLANSLDKPVNLTNGPQGITRIQRPPIPGFVLDSWNTIFGPIVGRPIAEGEFYNLFFYILALLIILMVIITVIRLDDSRIGRAWTAIREDELAASAMGINVVSYKLAAFAVAASFAGIMGVMFASSRIFVNPESFDFMQSIAVLSMVILGGLGSIPGVIVGAALVTILNLQVLQGLSLWLSSMRQSGTVIPLINFPLSAIPAQLDPAKYQRMLFGLILIIMMIKRPEGLIPAQRRRREMLAHKIEEGVVEKADITPLDGDSFGKGGLTPAANDSAEGTK